MIGSIKSPVHQVVAWLDDLLWLVYPELCVSCDKPLNTGEKCLCTSCRFHLPKTNFHLEEVNPIIKHFWGKVKVEAAAAYFLFTKGEKVQHLIHQLKYRKRKDIGVFLGELYGYDLKKSAVFSTVDVIIPVPLHPKKLRKRGYNQSECFAEGLSQSLKVPYDVKSLKRKKETQTQTRKHRFERFENVNNVFSVTKPEQLKGKHILLVDDVITTGSTLVACAEALLDVPGTKVSIAAIAYA
ncbi:MAG: ComF family protein [Bacteroidetes bacterium]|nr:ComF family protein [Bacteroidota bacterium]